ncbi:MAG: GNAT family N-acetyltransferase [Xanthomonadales bacterium]|nr:GNAT family N-acetyltransferase [Xanthomonadales bacterium]
MQLRIHQRLDEIPVEHWDRLRPDGNPFLSHAFLSGLETTGCIRNELGWQPWHLAWYRNHELVAALPAYLKGNSHGEFVFDWSWAQAHELAGGRYYPKLLCAVPYTPVTGPRLLTGRRADSALLQQALARSLISESRRLGLSGVHLNFPEADDRGVLADDERWLPRRDVQFHWHNAGYADFEQFLAALRHKKRKNIRAERQQLHAAGWRFQRLSGADLDESGWRFVHSLYVGTFAEKGNYPALSEAFFQHLGRTLADQVMVCLARSPDGRPMAMALYLHDERSLYGRYWGSLKAVPGLHFECCYYQGIEFAIERGLQVFEPGAQGEHKMARGFLPVLTHSFHHLTEPALQIKVMRWLEHERAAVDAWHDQLLARSPYAHATG